MHSGKFLGGQFPAHERRARPRRWSRWPISIWVANARNFERQVKREQLVPRFCQRPAVARPQRRRIIEEHLAQKFYFAAGDAGGNNRRSIPVLYGDDVGPLALLKKFRRQPIPVELLEHGGLWA